MAYGSVNVPGDLSGKQDLITGVPGQVVRIGADGKAAARDGGSNPNLLLNWDFRKPVNRNGEMEYTRAGYTIDLWSIESGNIKLSVENGFIRISRAISAGNPSFIQHITNSDKLNGKTVILSILYRSNCSAGFGFYINDGSNNKNAPESLGWNVVSLAVNLPEDISFLAARIPQMRASEPVGSYFDIKAVKLELGSHQTLARQNEDGEWEIIDPPDYDLQYLLCSQYSPITGEWVGSQHSNPNLLDNWYFADPINQRREVEYIGTGYTIDRWRIADGGKLTIENSGISFTGQSANLYDNFRQIIEADRMQSGKTYTFSLLYKSDNSDFTLTVRNINVSANANLPATNGDFNLVSVQFVANIPVETFWVGILREIVGSTNSIFLKAAKLELGPVQTLAHKEGDTWVLNDPPPNKALELAKCQRYQFVYDFHGWSYASISANGSVNPVQSQSRVLISLPIAVRLNSPTVMVKGDPLYILDDSGISHKITDILWAQAVGNSVRFACNVETTSSKGATIILVQASTEGNAKLIIDCNL